MKGKNLIVGMAAMVFIAVYPVSGPAAEPDISTLPKHKQEEWKRVKSGMDREYNVCREHCGGEKSCLDKCTQAYESRLQKEFQKLQTAEPNPPENDIQKAAACPFCGMDRQKFAHSRVFIQYDDGSILGTCSIHCAAADMAVNLDKSPAAIWVGDYNNRKLIDAEKAFWVMGGKKMGVMTKRAKWAFGNGDAAEQFMLLEGGQAVTFDEAMRAAYEDMYEDTKMIRERRKAKRMQMKAGNQH
jgi:nitrous oxide reductase accessory protein NosL